MTAHFYREAAEELAREVDWYEHRCVGLGRRFAERVEATLGTIEQHPLLGRAVGNDFRRVLVSGFPFLLIYELRDDAVIVVAVAHAMRRPGYWRRRRR